MGQRTATDTLFGIVAAFVEQRTWTQAALARKLEVGTETIRRRLEELSASGLTLHREEERPHVYWSVPKDWFPGALAFKADEAADLMRLVARAPRSRLRERLVSIVVGRLPNLGAAGAAAAGAQGLDLVRAPALSPEEERALAVVEDAARQKIVLKMRYFTASRRKVTWREASVHRVEVGARRQFIATCHVHGELRRFRVSNVLDAKLDKGAAFRAVSKSALGRFEAESLAGYHADAPPVLCAFFVRDPEADWVSRNLPDDAIEEEPAHDGARFRVETRGLPVLARFVAGLGDAARPETPELAAEVARIARGALANASR
jgi:predicted DNA-binding transcriptional regulator YafY